MMRLSQNLILFLFLFLFLPSCTSTLPKSTTKTEDGLYRIAFGQWTLDYYADYIFPPKPNELYPPREVALWEKLGILEAEWMMCTRMDPYMASTIHVTPIQSREQLELLLTNAGVRNLHMEVPEQEHVQSYARYQIISHQYPIRTRVAEWLIGDENDENGWYRVVFYSNEASDNMLSEGWKIVKTLRQISSEQPGLD